MLIKSANHARTLGFLWTAAAILLLITWLHMFSLIRENRGKELAAAERDLANLTRVSQEHADRTFRSADQVIRFIQSRYLEIGNRLDLTALSTHGVIDTEIFPQVGIIDANGIYVLANRPIKGRLDLSDREHFKVHVAAETGELFISKPVLGRATGKWSIQLTRRITRPNGEFAGVVVVSVDPGYFTRFYSELKLGGQGVMALYGLDGVARARISGDKEEFGIQTTNTVTLKGIARGRMEGSFTARSPVDGIMRLYHYRKIPRYSLAVLDGLDIDYVLANHQRSQEALWLQAVGLSLLIILLAVALTRYLQSLRHEMLARQLAQRETQNHNEQLNAIFALSPDGFVSFDGARRVKYASPAFTRLTGLGEDEVIGITEADFSARLSGKCIDQARFQGVAAMRKAQAVPSDLPRSDALRGRRQVIELTGPDKRVLEVDLRESQAETVSQILYLRDITHETEVDRLKSEFLSHAAHELRTPMASIHGYTELMLTQEFGEADRRDFLGTIFRQSELMISIINELLDLARIEARRGKDFVIAELDVRQLLHEVVGGFKTPAGRPSPHEPPADGVFRLGADRKKLTQAINNVLSNAYKYSGEGGTVSIELVAPAGARNVAGDGRAGMLGIRIRDQGIGMTPEQLARVCERFYRADTSGKIPGTGLGMSIVKEIIMLHGGDMQIESTPSVGTTVTLWLPCGEMEPDPEP